MSKGGEFAKLLLAEPILTGFVGVCTLWTFERCFKSVIHRNKPIVKNYHIEKYYSKDAELDRTVMENAHTHD